ncbi:NACHT and WD repeat domain-containing protein [Parafrankia discariae]|uniref:NACHT and WD repeat domain-containing protein n=1 Tax=Parafrankia discariae TaxID=365528 RepID=UPI00036602AC|nr:WD40 repeat domain-containing protein [Parafrankia discariae]
MTSERPERGGPHGSGEHTPGAAARPDQRTPHTVAGNAAELRTPPLVESQAAPTQIIDGYPARPPTSAYSAACPYPGLRGFDESSERWFFGRERMVADLVARVASGASRVGPLVLVGASGSGKSSLLRAGLLPALAREALPGSRSWPRLVMTPGEHPLEALVQRVVEATGMPTMARMLGDSLRREPERLSEIVRELLAAGAARGTRAADAKPRSAPDGDETTKQYGRHEPRMMIAVDQFEEVFTLCVDQGEREAFVRALCATAAGGAVVVIGLRADFYGTCASFPELVEVLQVNQVVVGPMAAADIREIVVNPARAAGGDVEPGLVELVLRDLGAAAGTGIAGSDQGPGHGTSHSTGTGTGTSHSLGFGSGFVADPGSLPLLAHALRATWFARAGEALTVADYLRVGGLTGAIAQTAEAAYTSLDVAAQQAVRPLLMRMIRLGENGADTRRRMRRAALLAEVPGPESATVLDALVAARLVEADAEGDRDTLQIAHEALPRSWPRLREWMDLDRAGAVALQQLRDAAEVWERGGRDPSYLFTGSRLAAAREWMDDDPNGDPNDRRDGDPNRDQDRKQDVDATTRRFFDASVRAEAEQQRAAARRTRRLRQLAAALAVLLLVAASLAGLTFQQSNASGRARDRALSQRIATQAESARRDNPALAAQLSLVALRTADTPEARGAVLWSFNGGGGVPTRYQAHSKSVGTVAYSRDGRLLATGSDDWTAALWDATDPRRLTPLARIPNERGGGHGRAVKAVAFNRNGTVLATGGTDGLAKLWDITDRARPRLLATLPKADSEVYGLAFDPSSDRLAVGGYGKSAYLYDVSDPAHPAKEGQLFLHLAQVVALEFSPDGAFLVAGDEGGSALLWSISDPSSPRPLKVLVEDGGPSTDGAGPIRAVSFGGDGHTVYTAGDGGYIREFTGPDLTHLAYAGRAGAGNAPMTGLGVDPVSGLVAVGGFRYVGVPIFDVDVDQYSLTFLDEGATVWDVAFSPDGHRLASVSVDGSLRIWEIPGPALIGRDGAQEDVVLNPVTGIVAITTDKAVELWDVQDPYAPRKLHVLTDVTKGENDPTGSSAFSPDGNVLAVGTGKNIVFYDIRDPAKPSRISDVPGLPGGTAKVWFSPDGGTLATGGLNAPPEPAFQARVETWDVTDLAHPRRLASVVAHRSSVRDLNFSPDGRTLLTAAERSVKLWDVSDPRRLRLISELPEFPAGVWDVRFSPDGRTLAAGGANPFAMLWDVTDLRAPRQIADLPGHSTSVTSVAFSRDGSQLATGSNDNTVRVWDVTDRDSPKLVEKLTRSAGSEAGVGEIIYTLDGERLVGVTFTVPAVVWDLDVDRVRARICERAGVGITAEEWRRFLPDLPYDPVCG